MWRYATSLFWAVRWQAPVRTLFLFWAAVAYFTGHSGAGGGLVALSLAPSLYFLGAPAMGARRYRTRAIWWTPAPPQWIRRQLPDPVLLGPVVWEVHAQDARRWRGATPREAARAYRQTYADELIRLIHTRPDSVALMSSGFNRLTPAEAQAIMAAGGTIWDGPLWPRLLRRYPPWIMALTQRRMFGGVVSRKDRRDPTAWVTWVVPARTITIPKGVRRV